MQTIKHLIFHFSNGIENLRSTLTGVYSLQACIKIQAFRLIKLILKIIIIISIIITYESSVKKKDVD